MVKIHNNRFEEEEIIIPTVLFFAADWCGPCRIMEPRLNDAREYFKGVDFLYIDTDENQELAAKLEVRSVPTTIFVDGNGKKKLIVGNLDREQIEAEVREIIGEVEDRESQLLKIIKEAEEELREIRKPKKWSDACEFLYNNMKSKVVSTLTGQSYHGYEGIGIIYSNHKFKNRKDSYRLIPQ